MFLHILGHCILAERARKLVLMGIYSVFLKLNVCVYVAMRDLVHAVETVHGIS